MKLIDKDAILAEIEKRIADNKKDIERASHKNLEEYFEGYEDALVLLKTKFLDTLEVKEVDLDFIKVPVSDELEEAANNAVISLVPSFGQKHSDGSYVSNYRDCFEREEFINLFKDGANWQKEQFEKNRLAHCEALTEEQAQIESDFVTQHLKENNRTPTFIDAIEYGMKLQMEQMMKDAIDTFIKQGHTDLGIFINGLNENKFSFGDKVKVIIIKEE